MVDLEEVIEALQDNCRLLNAAKAEISFEKEEFKLSIILKRKDI